MNIMHQFAVKALNADEDELIEIMKTIGFTVSDEQHNHGSFHLIRLIRDVADFQHQKTRDEAEEIIVCADGTEFVNAQDVYLKISKIKSYQDGEKELTE